MHSTNYKKGLIQALKLNWLWFVRAADTAYSFLPTYVWGLVGLVGLVGLLGLWGRGPSFRPRNTEEISISISSGSDRLY